MLLHARVSGIDCHKGEPLVSTSDELGAPGTIRSEVALWVGALRHGQQVYNLKGAAAYLAVIIPLAGLAIMLPRYTTSAPGGEASPSMAVFLILMSVGLWGYFSRSRPCATVPSS